MCVYHPLLRCFLPVCCPHSHPFSRSAPNPVSKQPAEEQSFKKHSSTFGGGAREKERGKVKDSQKPSEVGGGGGARKSSSSSSVKDGGAKGCKGKDKVCVYTLSNNSVFTWVLLSPFES